MVFGKRFDILNASLPLKAGLNSARLLLSISIVIYPRKPLIDHTLFPSQFQGTIGFQKHTSWATHIWLRPHEEWGEDHSIYILTRRNLLNRDSIFLPSNNYYCEAINWNLLHEWSLNMWRSSSDGSICGEHPPFNSVRCGFPKRLSTFIRWQYPRMNDGGESLWGWAQ